MPTTEQVNLMLHLFELRRESKLRDAREWFFANFHPSSMEEAMKSIPPGSEGNTYMRMVVSYWDMAANLANRGLLDEELFFETSGEQWIVWERLKPITAAWRTIFKNPLMFSNLEEHVRRLESWREKRAPGSNEATRQVMAQMAATATAAKTRTAGN
jgi:hypothetical protein